MALSPLARHRIIEKFPNLFLLIGCIALHSRHFYSPDSGFASFRPHERGRRGSRRPRTRAEREPVTYGADAR
jgi:hypothetical protein